jgi:hypothetical protein
MPWRRKDATLAFADVTCEKMTGNLPEAGESKIQVSNQKEEVSSFPTWATVMEHKVARTTRVSFYIGVVQKYRSPISFLGDKPYHQRNHRAQ